MQKSGTLKFWDNFYEKEEERGSHATEWIVHPSEQLFKTIANILVPSTCSSGDSDIDIDNRNGGVDVTNILHALEIGCGNSEFSLLLWEYLRQTKGYHLNIIFHATDVSPICIQQNIERDADRIADAMVTATVEAKIKDNDGLVDSDHQTSEPSSSYVYSVLNVLERDDTLDSKHSIILDKGCLDTFLYRSSKKQTNQDIHPTILRTLLDNIHTWLSDDGKYIIISPRNKIRSVRDYLGFSSVERIKLEQVEDTNDVEEESHADTPMNTNEDGVRVNLGCLDGQKGSKSAKSPLKEETTMFMYVCTKNNEYKVEGEKSKGAHSQPQFRGVVSLPSNEETCDKCGISFKEFLGMGGVGIHDAGNMQGKAARTWARRWIGHKTHCRGRSLT